MILYISLTTLRRCYNAIIKANKLKENRTDINENIVQLQIVSVCCEDGNAKKSVNSKHLTFAQLWLFLQLSHHVRIIQFWKNTLQVNCKENRFYEYSQFENLQLCARVVVKTANVLISRCCFADDGTEFFPLRPMKFIVCGIVFGNASAL